MRMLLSRALWLLELVLDCHQHSVLSIVSLVLGARGAAPWLLLLVVLSLLKLKKTTAQMLLSNSASAGTAPPRAVPSKPNTWPQAPKTSCPALSAAPAHVCSLPLSWFVSTCHAIQLRHMQAAYCKGVSQNELPGHPSQHDSCLFDTASA